MKLDSARPNETNYMNNKENTTSLMTMSSPAPKLVKDSFATTVSPGNLDAGNNPSSLRRAKNPHLDSTTIPDLEAVKARQKATWESGDFGQIARTIENVADEFMARQPLRRMPM